MTSYVLFRAERVEEKLSSVWSSRTMTSYVLFRAERVKEELPCGVLAQWRHMS